MTNAEEIAPRPGWLTALPGMRAAPALTRGQRRLLWVLGAANLIDSYDLAIMGLALPQIQAGLAVAEAEVGGLTAMVRLGTVPAILLTVLADGVGRRRMLLFTILGFTFCTALTAFARTPAEFMLLQFLARTFIAAEGMLAVVVVVEEFDATARGFGIGVLGALGALGHGVASIVFAAVNVLPFGWRALYLLGIAPLLMIAWFRRSLHETRRFQAQQAARASATAWRDVVRPVRHLLHMYPGRVIALSAAVFPVSFVLATAMMFTSKFLQNTHGYSPGNVATLYLTVGVLAPIGNIVAGSLGDRFGRKRLMIGALVVNAVALALFYNTSGVWVPPAWGMSVLTITMVEVLFAALGSELFPTSYRSTASGLRAAVATIAAALGLWLEGYLYQFTGSHAGAITWMLIGAPIAPIVIALFLPETASRELEDIAPERHVAVG